MTTDELLAFVDAAFARTGAGLAPWPDPHPDRSPLDEEYSRVTDAARWRLVGARADAWLAAVADLGLAGVEHGVDGAVWEAPPATVVSRTDRAVPRVDGGLPLVVARSRLGDVDDAGVTLGAGDPAVTVTWVPACGCDACDSGSQDALDELDAYVLPIVSGAFRRLTAGDRRITVLGDGRWQASGIGFGAADVLAVLADPTGWHELAGPSWLGP